MATARFTTMLIEFGGFSEIQNDGKKNGKCSLSGFIGNIFSDLFITNWLEEGNNCTLMGSANFGSYATDTGMKGDMSSKKADVALFATKVWESSIDHINYTIPLYVDELRIICSYNYTDQFTSTDLIDAYLDFHWSYYLSLIFAMVGLVLAWNVCSKIASRVSNKLMDEMTNSRLPGYWIAVCAILGQSQYPNISRATFSILSTCIAIYVFIAIDCFMKNVMSADLSVMKQPRVLETYQEILDRENLQLMFIPGWEESAFFEFAPPGTVEAEMWKKRYILESLGPGTIAEVWDPIKAQEIILIARNMLALSTANLGLTKMIEMGIDYIRALAVKDETGKAFTNGYMIQRDAPQALKDYYFKRSYRIANSGILAWFMDERAPWLFGGSEINIDKYVSSKLDLPDAPEPEIRFENIKIFYKVYLGCMFISSLALIYEVLFSKQLSNMWIRTEEKLMKMENKYYGYRTRGTRRRRQVNLSRMERIRNKFDHIFV